MRERTVLGPTGLDQFFLSQNVQFSAYILYVHVEFCSQWIGSWFPVQILSRNSLNEIFTFFHYGETGLTNSFRKYVHFHSLYTHVPAECLSFASSFFVIFCNNLKVQVSKLYSGNKKAGNN